MSIKSTVEALCKKYDTRDPFEISTRRGVMIMLEPLGTIRGYYARSYRKQVIHVNSDLEEHQLLFTCAHELAHSVMHPSLCTPFLRANTLLSVDRLEVEANRFAVDLIYSDEEMQDYLQYPVSDISRCLNLPEPLVEYRLRSIQ